MTSHWLPTNWISSLKREWMLYHLGDQRFRFMWDAPPPDEWVALDCETTGLNTKTDNIISIGAVRIKANKIMTSERLELLIRPDKQDVAQGMSADEAVTQLLHFIGSRPLVGYYLEFDVAMINRVLFPILGMGLPQPKIEVSAMYYDYKYKQLSALVRDSSSINLRFENIMKDLNLPLWTAHDALNDAIMAALAFLKLRQLQLE